MRGKSRVCCLVISMVFILVLGSVTPITYLFDYELQFTERVSEPAERSVFRAGIPHSPIAIDGDANFTLTASNEGWHGDGSSNSPFIIDGLDIDRGGGAGHCISIINTRVNFTIQNCVLTGANVSGAGIHMVNVTYGKLIENICRNNIYGIALYGSNYNTVGHNNCSSNSDEGIRLNTGAYNIISDNVCNYNGWYGIHVYGVTASTTGNTLCNNTCTQAQGWGIFLVGFSNNLWNNKCSNNQWGIYIGGEWNKLIDNTCTSSDWGIEVGGDWNTLTDNTCDSNTVGIRLFRSYYHTVNHNDCTGNEIGISLWDSEDNIFSWNTFAENTASEGIGNTLFLPFNNSFLNNYWSSYTDSDADQDGFGDTPHPIGGISDPSPLMYPAAPPKWTQPPTNQIIELGTSFRYDLNATYLGPFSWDVKATAFSVDTEGVVTSRIILPVEVYTLEVTLTNMYGFSRTGIFRVTVQDTTAPVWMIYPIDQVLEHGDAFDYQLPAMDLSGIDRWELNDTTHFTLTESHSLDGSTARISNGSVLEPGGYGLRIDVFDIYDNLLSTVITITVNTTTTSSPTTGSTPDGVDPVVTLVLGAGLGGVAVVMVVIVFLRKRS